MWRFFSYIYIILFCNASYKTKCKLISYISFKTYTQNSFSLPIAHLAPQFPSTGHHVRGVIHRDLCHSFNLLFFFVFRVEWWCKFSRSESLSVLVRLVLIPPRNHPHYLMGRQGLPCVVCVHVWLSCIIFEN